MTRRVAFLAAGALWLGLGILLILTVFGTLVGVAMAYLVGLRRSVLAARAGAVLGVLLFIPCQLVLEAMGCRSGGCSLEPYLFAFGLPASVTVLNLVAGWPAPGTGPNVAAALPAADNLPPVLGTVAEMAPGQQLLWEPDSWESAETNLPDPDPRGLLDAPASADPAAATVRMWSKIAT